MPIHKLRHGNHSGIRALRRQREFSFAQLLLLVEKVLDRPDHS